MDRIKQLAKKWGTKIVRRPCWNDYAFDGKTIALLQRSKVRTESNLIHDIAHFVVAPPKRRKLPEFGLGDSPDTNKYLEPVVTDTAAQREEELASVLGIYWERELGLNWRKTFEYHSWDYIHNISEQEEEIFSFEAAHKFATRLRELRKRKII